MFTTMSVQSLQDQQHFSALGAKRVNVTGNIKADITITDEQRQQAANLKQQWSLQGTRKIVFVASTHPNEEALLINSGSNY